MQENREKLQEIYDQEHKPPLLGHVEQLTDEPKMEDETERPSQEPSSMQQERSVLLAEPDEQITEALQEQERWDQLEQCMATEKDKQAKEREASDLDLEAEMERDAQVTSTENIQQDPAGSTATDQPTNEKETDQRDLAGIMPDLELQESDYSKQYRTGPQEHSDRGAAQREKQERDERERIK